MFSSVSDIPFPWSYVTMNKKQRWQEPQGPSSPEHTLVTHEKTEARQWHDYSDSLNHSCDTLRAYGNCLLIKSWAMERCLVLIIPLSIPVLSASQWHLWVPSLPSCFWNCVALTSCGPCCSVLNGQFIKRCKSSGSLSAFSLTASYGLECPPPENVQMALSPSPSIHYVSTT